jgi:sulfopyruvate decarboxylase subunit alpha
VTVVTASRAGELADIMHEAGIDFVASLPDSRIAPWIAAVEQDERFIHVRLSSEDEGVGVCAGAWFGGRKPCLLIQNSGMLEATNDLVTLAMFSQIPLLMLVAYRGYIGEPHSYHGTVGRVTEPVLRALGIQHVVVDRPDEVSSAIARAALLAETCSYPVAVLLTLRAIGGAA